MHLAKNHPPIACAASPARGIVRAMCEVFSWLDQCVRFDSRDGSHTRCKRPEGIRIAHVRVLDDRSAESDGATRVAVSKDPPSRRLWKLGISADADDECHPRHLEDHHD